MSAWRELREERRAGRRLARQIAVLVLRARGEGFASKLAPTNAPSRLSSSHGMGRRYS